jgi:hypothetical protein
MKDIAVFDAQYAEDVLTYTANGKQFTLICLAGYFFVAEGTGDLTKEEIIKAFDLYAEDIVGASSGKYAEWDRESLEKDRKDLIQSLNQ